MTIEKRLENLERGLARAKRRSRWLLGVALLVVGLFAIGSFETAAIKLRAQGAGKEREVRAEAFILEDENGETRALLSIVNDEPALTLFDKNGMPPAALALAKDGPGLILYDKNDKPRAGLGIIKDNPRLALFDKKGRIIWSAIK